MKGDNTCICTPSLGVTGNGSDGSGWGRTLQGMIPTTYRGTRNSPHHHSCTEWFCRSMWVSCCWLDGTGSWSVCGYAVCFFEDGIPPVFLGNHSRRYVCLNKLYFRFRRRWTRCISEQCYHVLHGGFHSSIGISCYFLIPCQGERFSCPDCRSTDGGGQGRLIFLHPRYCSR